MRKTFSLYERKRKRRSWNRLRRESCETETHKMADQRFRALSSCLVVALLVVIVAEQNNDPERGLAQGSSSNTDPGGGKSPPLEIAVKLGSDAILTCDAEDRNQPSDRLEWQKKGSKRIFFKILNSKPRIDVLYSRRLHMINSSVIILSEAKESDAGIYRCRTMRSGSEGTIVTHGRWVVLKVTGKVGLPSRRKTVVEKYPAVLDCLSDTNLLSENVVCSWSKDGADVTSDARATIITSGALFIKSTRRTDSGVYQCTFNTIDSNDLVTFFGTNVLLDVQFTPTITDMPDTVTVPEGLEARLPCVSVGNPSTHFTNWTRHGESLTSLPRFVVLEKGSLLILDVQRTDTGEYACTPYNKVGAGVSKTTKLVLKGTVEKEPDGTVEKETKGLTVKEITINSAVGSVIFIIVAALAAILFKKHRAMHKPNIPDDADEEEITPYATVRISRIFPPNAQSNGPGDIPLRTVPFQLRTPPEERAAGRTEFRNSPYENTDHLGRSSVNPLECLFYQPRYENEAVDSETHDVVIRPGYDKLVPATRKKRRENGGGYLGQRLPCGMVDTHCLSEYDSLIRETDLRCKSRRGDITNSESEDDMNIHTILEVPFSDERSPACSMDKKKNQENSLGDIEFGCIGNDSTTSDVQD